MELEVRSGLRHRRKHRASRRILRTIEKHRTALVIALGICALAVAGYITARTVPFGEDAVRVQLVEAGRRAVIGAISDRLKTSFCSPAEVNIEQLGEGKYRVSGWVDLIPESGLTISNTYSCTLTRTGEDTWTARDIAVTAR